MVYNSLTDTPHNLKEGLDWLMALKGVDATNNLKAVGEAIYNLLQSRAVDTTAFEAVKEGEIEDQKSVQNMRGTFIGNKNAGSSGLATSKRLTAGAIAERLGKLVDGCEQFLDSTTAHERYVSAYSSEATWESSCAQDPEACAATLLGIAPMLYTGLQGLRWVSQCASYGGSNSQAAMRMPGMLEALGYNKEEGRSYLTGSYVAWSLRGVDRDTLSILYDLAGF
ncbi:hypothetical protein, conserved [Babesia ovata]|uniref:Uncharacterized protein n=1 Tax=Babesia ovata TaxID=189622 RepID=A0A2H6KBH1_9APIC|nr:uncharacterized protein BOVATA_018270 [Babesia ovata]GBE60334.1 hypothetical protein, conserved [Babesia ovata]